MRYSLSIFAVASAFVSLHPIAACAVEPLPQTKPLGWDGDLASKLVDGVDRFLLHRLEESVAQRSAAWHRDVSSWEAYQESVEPNRRRFAHILGLRDDRHQTPSLELLSTTSRSAEIENTATHRVLRVRWQVFTGVHGEGLLLEPKRPATASVLAIPDVGQAPESLLGLEKDAAAPWVRKLAASGCRVVVPAIVSRKVRKRRRAELTDREFLYRSAFELGRHLIGYELQQVLAIVDWFDSRNGGDGHIGIVGWGEGGLLAFYAAALDDRIDAACVSGYFGPREKVWQEPIDRNVFGLLQEFGDAEIASLIAPRKLVIDATAGPTTEVRTRGGAPFRLEPVPVDQVKQEARRAEDLVTALDWRIELGKANTSPGPSDDSLSQFLTALSAQLTATAPLPTSSHASTETQTADRQARLVDQLDRHNQRLLEASPYVRRQFLQRLDTSSLDAYQKTAAWYRDYFADRVIGRFDDALLPANPRTRKVYEQPKWSGYEVVLDVFPDVFAYGVLLLPKDIRPGERRPVVVCQHGLEGRPQDTIEGDHRAYHDFAAKLAERGFITFAPQNLYIFKDRFRTLQRKANPLGKTLFSIMVPQHQQITDWLASLPQVDPERIAFYGLSYGGKSAMRIPPWLTAIASRSARRISMTGCGRTLRRFPPTATCGRANTKSSNGTSAAPLTTRRWRR